MTNRRQLLKVASMGVLAAVIPKVLTAAKATRVLLVHGRGQQGLDPTVLKAEWVDTLKRGAAAARRPFPGRIDIAFPFYGDALERFTRAAEIPLTSEITSRGPGVDDEFLVFQAEFAESVRQQAGVTDAEVDAEYGPNQRPRGPLNWEWVQATLRAVDKHAGGIGQKTLEVFTRDVFLYCTRAGVRDEIDRIVSTQLTEEPTVVVAHSLGTLVAYNILRTDRRRLQVPAFITVGSPLGVRSVRDHFRPLRYPPVDGWYNAFDGRDVVALYPLDASNFPVQPAIENYGTVNNHTENRHGIVGYLDDATVAGRIIDALAS
jgi:hypothetical protein